MKRSLLPLLIALLVATAFALSACEDVLGADATTGSDSSTGGDTAGPTPATFTALYAGYFSNCVECHAPNAPGRPSDIEQTLDFSTRATAYATITQGMAKGLTGNTQACNGVRFIGPTAASSLLMAVIDQPTRQVFDSAVSSDCDVDAISDETLKVGFAPPGAFVLALADWLDNGAPNN